MDTWREMPGSTPPRIRLPTGPQVQSSPQLTPPRTPQEATTPRSSEFSRASMTPVTTGASARQPIARHRLPELSGSPRQHQRSRPPTMGTPGAEVPCATSSTGLPPPEAPTFPVGGQGLNTRAVMQPTAPRQPPPQEGREPPPRMSMREFVIHCSEASPSDVARTPPTSRSQRVCHTPERKSPGQEEPSEASPFSKQAAQESPEPRQSPAHRGLPPLARTLSTERPTELELGPRGGSLEMDLGMGGQARQLPQPRARSLRKVPADTGLSLPAGGGRAADLASVPSPLRLPLRPRARSLFGGGDLGSGMSKGSPPKLGLAEGQQVRGREASDLLLEDATPASNGHGRWRRQP
uniref:Uncharacterized protein n=2 Tax=Alexandrium monilatum TaxID=311494 RepID=A0A6T1FMR1_9DINO